VTYAFGDNHGWCPSCGDRRFYLGHLEFANQQPSKSDMRSMSRPKYSSTSGFAHINCNTAAERSYKHPPKHENIPCRPHRLSVSLCDVLSASCWGSHWGEGRGGQVTSLGVKVSMLAELFLFSHHQCVSLFLLCYHWYTAPSFPLLFCKFSLPPDVCCPTDSPYILRFQRAIIPYTFVRCVHPTFSPSTS